MLQPRAFPPLRYLLAAGAVLTAAAIACWALVAGDGASFGGLAAGGVLAACASWFLLHARPRRWRLLGVGLAAGVGVLAATGLVAVRPPLGASAAEWASLLLAAVALALTRSRFPRAGDLRQFARLVGIAVPFFILALTIYDAPTLKVVAGFGSASFAMAMALGLLLAAIGVDRPATSLRWQIAYIGVAVVSPLAALMLHFASSEREFALDHAADRLRASAQIVAERQEALIEQARQTLSFIARSPQVRASSAGCAEEMAEFLPVVASLKSIYSIRRDGSVACASTTRVLSLNLGDRDYVKEAFARRAFTVSGVFLTRNLGEPRIALTNPVADADDMILAATLDLSSFGPPLERALAEGASATLIDKNGVVIARRPDMPQLIGSDLRSRDFVSRALSRSDRPFVAPELDGAASVFIARPVLHGQSTLIIGLPREQVVGPVDRRLNDRLLLIAAILTASLALGVIGSEVAFLRPLRRLIVYAGELEAGNLSARPQVGSSGEVRTLGRALALSATAIEDRERRLAEAEALFRRLFEHSPDAKIIVRVDERHDLWIETWNAAAAVMSGLEAPAVIGKRLRDVLPNGVGEALERELLDPIDPLGIMTIERELMVNGVSTAVELLQMPLHGPDGEVERIFVSARDISERKRVERLKNEFVSTVSHELRTPLTSIAGSLGLLVGGAAGPLADKVAGLIAIAHSNSLRLVRLINDILDIEKIEAGRMTFEVQTLVIADVIDQAIQGLKGYADEFGVTVAFETMRRDLLVRGDADRLNQVVTNLLSNAIKFSPAGETVSVGLKADGEIVVVTIRDRGPGVPESFRPRIFTKFAQADGSDSRRKGGTGLGLAIAREIVERHAGAVSYRDAEGGGAEFEMRLSRHTVSERGVAVSFARPARVLVCEDDPLIATILAEQMRNAGFEARTAGGVQEALRIVAEDRIDAMLVDLRLPDGDGVSLIRTLRSRPASARIPIVVVSADAAAREADPQTAALDVADWLEKPVDTRRIAELLSASLGRASSRPRILHVEDDLDLCKVVSASLSPAADVVSVGTLSGAYGQLTSGSFDLAIVDVALEDGSGLDLLTALQAAGPRPIPAVIFSARDVDLDQALHAEATMTKSRTSLSHLVDTVRKLIEKKEAV
jgi:PAS domain S-box-containing protein